MVVKCPECKSKNIQLHPSSVEMAPWIQMSDGRFRATATPEMIGYHEGQALMSCRDCSLEFETNPEFT